MQTFLPNINSTLAAALVLIAPSAIGQSAAYITIGKGVVHRQTSAETVVPLPNNPYRFTAAVYPIIEGTLDSAAVRPPRGQWLALSNPADTEWPFFFLSRAFPTRAALESAFPNGDYTVAPQHVVVPLRGSAFPNTPVIVNWETAQDIDTTTDFRLKWRPFEQRFASFIDDAIFLEFLPYGGPAYPQGYLSPDRPSRLSRDATSMVIPADFLAPGQTLSGSLIFYHDTRTGAGDGYAFAGRFRETRFTIHGAPLAPPQGRIQFANDFIDQTTAAPDDDDIIGTWEGFSAVDVVVSRTGGSAGTVTFTLTTVDGSATAGKDYIGTTQTVSLAEGETGYALSVPLINDNELEGDEQFYVTITDVTGGAELHKPSVAVVHIRDNESADAGIFHFDSANYLAAESNRIAILTVVRSGGAYGPMTVAYDVESGTAHPAEDFAPESGVVSFADGQTQAELRIPIVDDVAFENNETFQVQLHNPVGDGGSLGSPDRATVTILSDDLPDLIETQSRVEFLVSGRINVTGCSISGGHANGSIEFLTQDGTRFTASGFMVMPNSRLTQNFRGTVAPDGRMSGSYTWRGTGDHGSGSFSGKFLMDENRNPGLRLSFHGQSALGCQQSGNVATP